MAKSHLQRFLAMVSHDLRGPLFAILANAELLRSASAAWGGEDQECLRRIEASAQSVRRLVQDLLDAARIGEGRFDVTPIPMDFVQTVNRVVQQCQTTTSRHVITLDAPDTIAGQWDSERIGQLFANLIGNAITYSPEGGGIRVQLRLEGSTVVASVTDDGIGIPPDQIDHLFQPFSRLNAETKGNGLGLYIARGIVEGHGGSIHVESPASPAAADAIPRGTCFLVRIPLQPLHPIRARTMPRLPHQVAKG
jgi:signal transduction histidine kinase